jgi:hypothetical protein
VALPMGVIPVILVQPSTYLKWVIHLCLRGLNNGSWLPVIGSSPVSFALFAELQKKQLSAKF